MCGSSLDGIDVAWVRGADLLHFSTAPLPEHLRKRLRPLLRDEPLAAHEIAALEVGTALAFVDAVRRSGYRGRPDFDVDRLLRYARVCRVEQVMSPYLEALL